MTTARPVTPSWVAMAALLLGCRSGAPEPRAAPRPRPVRRVTADDAAIPPAFVEDPVAAPAPDDLDFGPAADGPEVSCEDPVEEIRTTAFREPGPEPEPDAVRIGAVTFHAGCIPPTRLRRDLIDREPMLTRCFRGVSAGVFTARLRLEWTSPRYGMTEVAATALRVGHARGADAVDDGVTLDQGDLRRCIETALDRIYIDPKSTLPAIVVVEFQRGYGEDAGGVVGP